MWKRKQKQKTIDERAVKDLLFKLPGVDHGNIIPAPTIAGTEHFWGFIPDRKQPKSILDIMIERALEEQRKAHQ